MLFSFALFYSMAGGVSVVGEEVMCSGDVLDGNNAADVVNLRRKIIADDCFIFDADNEGDEIRGNIEVMNYSSGQDLTIQNSILLGNIECAPGAQVAFSNVACFGNVEGCCCTGISATACCNADDNTFSPCAVPCDT